MKYFIILAVLTGCVDNETYKVSDFKKPMKYCIEACLHSSFKMFHHKGESWGTGSSSMQGLGQAKIFDRVMSYCTNFYKEENCCTRPTKDYSHQVVVSYQHHYKYGACVKGK